MSDTIRFIDLAKKLRVGIDTIRRTVAKLGDDLGIVVQRESHSSRAQCLSVDDADKLIRYLEERGKDVAATSPGETFGFLFELWLFLHYPTPTRAFS